MKAKDKLAVWRNRITVAKRYRDEFRGSDEHPGSDFAVAAYRGDTKPASWSASDPWVNINRVKAAIRAGLPSLLYQNPKFKITPKRPLFDEQGRDISWETALAKSKWLNHTWSESEGNKHARVAIQNAFVGLGVAKGGYCPHFQDDEVRGEFALTPEGDFILDEQGLPELAKGEYLVDEDGEIVFDEDGIPVLHPGSIQKEEFFVEVVDFDNMLFDAESGHDFKKHRFVIEEWVRPLSEIRNDTRYRRSIRRKVQPNESLGSPLTESRLSLSRRNGNFDPAVSDDDSRVRGYDIYDFQNNRYMVLVDGVKDAPDANEDFLLDDPMPPGMDHGPFRVLKFTEDVGDEFYPIPDAVDMGLVNREYNITRSQMMIHRDHTKTRYLEGIGAYERDDTNEDEERAKWVTGGDGTSIKVGIMDAIQPAPKPQLDNSFFQAVPNILEDFSAVAAQSDEQRGAASADTATQASIIASGAELRNSDRRDNQVQVFLSEIGRMLLISAQENASQDTYVKVHQSGDESKPFIFAKISPELLAGEFDVEVSIGSTLPTNDPRALQQLTQVLTVLGQNPQLGQIPGLMKRFLGGLNLDPALADEIKEWADNFMAQQNQQGQGGDQAGPSQAGQQLQELLTGGVGNQQGGMPTGAPVN